MRHERLLTALFVVLCVGCGNGVPITLRIDSFTTKLDMEQASETLESALQAQGMLPAGATLPELWSGTGLPNIAYELPLQSAPLAINLTPTDPNQAKKYAQVTRYAGAIERIELNQIVMRVEENTSNVDLPALSLQSAEGLTPNAEDRKLWYTLGTVSAVQAGEIVDQDFQFQPGGESFIDSQLSSSVKQFSIRTNGLFRFDTTLDPQRPSGSATIRVIIVATFFVALEKL